MKVVIPGGFGTRALMHDERMLDWLRTAHKTTTSTTSVCTGSLVLGAAGLLDGLDATTHWAARDLLEEQGARYVEARFVEQGKIATAAGGRRGSTWLCIWRHGSPALRPHRRSRPPSSTTRSRLPGRLAREGATGDS